MAAQDFTKRRQLLLQTEKMLLQPIHPHLFTYCPTMDLLALVTDEANLDVYRINGQRAFGLKRKSEDVTVDALQWEFNGKSIAVSWSDGSTDLVSAETGKVSHKDLKLPAPSGDGDSMLEEEPVSRVKCMGSCLNFIDVDAVKRRTGVKQKQTNGSTPTKTDVFGQPTTDDWDEFMDDTTVEDFLERQPDFQALDIAPDLPDQLAMMDTETLLPKLPAIPLPPALPFMRVSAADSGAFSTQPEVDALLHSHHLKDHNSVGMFIRCSDQGTVHPSIYDSKETVSIQLPIAWNLKSTPLLHASHPYSYSHALLMRTHSSDTARTQLAFVPLTLNFIPSAGIYLHLIATKTSQLQNLLLYVTQTLQRIRTYHKHGSDLPSKFMMGISETLEEKNQGDLATNLFHTACTGNCPPLVREWLVDELMEQGHKRWENAVTTSLTTLLALVHENLIPAIDRCALLISRLRGLAQFHDQNWIFTSPVTEFTALLEIVKNMRLLAHTVLLYAGEEKRQFHAFSKWLRFVIDFEATEPDSNSRMEMEGRDAGVDTLLVLDYIRYSLGKSNLQPYLQPEAQLGAAARKGGAASYEDTIKAIEVLKEGGKFKEEALCLEHVLGGFRDGVGGLLRQVSRWQEGNVQMDGGVVLEEVKEEEGESIDMRMIFEPASGMSTYIAIIPPSSPHSLLIHRINHTPSITSLPKDIISHAPTTLSFPTGSHILDAKFADDTTLLVLLQHAPQTTGKKETQEDSIVAFTYAPLNGSGKADIPFSSAASSADIQSRLLPSGGPPSAQERCTVEVTAAMVEERTRHVFEGRWTPLKLVVNGRKGRRVVVVLGSDKKHYRILDMDYRQRGKLQDADGGGEAGSDTDTVGDGDTEMSGA